MRCLVLNGKALEVLALPDCSKEAPVVLPRWVGDGAGYGTSGLSVFAIAAWLRAAVMAFKRTVEV